LKFLKKIKHIYAWSWIKFIKQNLGYEIMSSLETVENAKVPEKRFSIPGVELFGIVNKYGRMIDCWGKKDLEISKNKKDMFLMQVALCNSMQHDFNEEFGTVNFCVTHREKMEFVSFPLEENIVLAVTDKKTDYETIVNRIRRMYTTHICNQNLNKGVFSQK